MSELLRSVISFDPKDLATLAVALLLDFAVVFVVVRLIYFPTYKRRDYAFTYVLLNAITFSLCFLLRKVPIEMGFALGLFAVFGILRYRTEAIRIRDLTYLFVMIGVAILNAVSSKDGVTAELLLVNAIIVLLVSTLESRALGGREEERTVIYDNLELLRPERQAELMEDLRARTGLMIHHVSVGRLDLLRDTAELTVFYRRQPSGGPPPRSTAVAEGLAPSQPAGDAPRARASGGGPPRIAP